MEDVEARSFGAWSDWGALEGLWAALDRRGERENVLLGELSKVDPGFSQEHLVWGPAGW